MNVKRYENNKRMSRVVEHNGLLFLSGHGALEVAEKETSKQTEALLKKIENVLKKYGSSKENIIYATIYLRDITHKPEFDEEWEKWIDEESAPARATVEAGLAHDNLMIEISVVAAKN